MFHRFSGTFAATLFMFHTATALSQELSCGCEISQNKIIFRGKADVVDADTIWIGIHKVRLFGIEGLEDSQPCTKDGARFHCYDKSFDFLKSLTTNKEVTCKIDRSKFGRPSMDRNRYLGTCFVENLEINRTLVEKGWVLAGEGTKGEIYQTAEATAKANKLGIHQTSFDPPWVWRDKNKPKHVKCPTGTHQCVSTKK